MFGSMGGNIVAALYYMFFQTAGFSLATVMLKKEKFFTKLLIGSCVGTLMLHWLPVLFAFIMGFTIIAHVSAVLVMIPMIVYAKKKAGNLLAAGEFSSTIKENTVFTVLLLAVFVLWCWLLNTHIIPASADGAFYTGQSTYGDMSMHLSFITGIVNQQTFPPIYTIFPDAKLAYPFLNASISSSLLLMGASLRWAYIFPMLVAFIQVVAGVYHFAMTVAADKVKALLCLVLYIFNGGLGFVYFIGGGETGYNFSQIFTGYYTTPTNLVDKNIRWVNIIADILLPQRASLFGYAMAFCALWLLYCAVWKGKKEYFVIAGVVTASLPLIHTHSFLAVVLVSAAWLLLYLYRQVVQNGKWYGMYFFSAFVIAMCAIQYYAEKGALQQNHFFAIGVAGICLCVVAGTVLLCKHVKQKDIKTFIGTWGIYIAIGVIISAPQILLWTVGQVSRGGFLRGHFNWGNLGDFYPWFYIKNIGVPLALIVGAIYRGGKKVAEMVVPAGVIWFVAELILFTPNTYDNNKLLYVAYMLLCVAAAEWGVELYRKYNRAPITKVVALCFMMLCTFSAVLTLGREAVSEYQIFAPAHVKLAQYVEQHTQPEDVFLTDTRHNNEIASLTGRKIVCGSDIYLYYHGLNTTQRKEDIRSIYEQPDENGQLLSEYSIDYIVVSSYENSAYNVDRNWLENNCVKVFDYDGVVLYKIEN